MQIRSQRVASLLFPRLASYPWAWNLLFCPPPSPSDTELCRYWHYRFVYMEKMLYCKHSEVAMSEKQHQQIFIRDAACIVLPFHLTIMYNMVQYGSINSLKSWCPDRDFKSLESVSVSFIHAALVNWLPAWKWKFRAQMSVSGAIARVLQLTSLLGLSASDFCDFLLRK